VRENVGELLTAGAEAHPERTLFAFYGGDGGLREQYSYGSFLARASFTAECLRDAGIVRGEPVLLVYPPGTEMAVAFFACAMIGAIPVPAPLPSPARRHAGWTRLAHIARHAGARRVLSTAALAARAMPLSGATGDSDAEPGLPQLAWIATDVMNGALGAIRRAASEVLFIQYTSGSTSLPRGVAVTHANVVHNAGLCVDHDQPIGVSWLPHFHDMGLLGYFLFSLVKHGQSHVFAPVDFLRRPVLWFSLITRVRATITTAPNAAYEYCLREDKVGEADLRDVDLASLRAMVNCAEPVRAGTFERFRRRFARHGLREGTQVAGYGLAEHTLCVTTGGSRETTGAGTSGGADGPRRFISCGRPRADVDLRIVDPDRRSVVPEGTVGEIWVDSPSKAAGYWRLPEESEAHFRARIEGAAHGRGYLRTGDLGFVSGGELFVCGRLRDMLIVNGRNVFPSDIESVIEERFPEHLSGRVAAFGTIASEGENEELVVLIEAGVEAPALALLRSLVQEACGIGVGAMVRVPRGTIVRTSSGKVARPLCRQKWEAGEITILEILRGAADGGTTDVEALVDRLAAEAAALGDPNATLDRLGLDSVTFVELSLAIEDVLRGAGLDSAEVVEQAADLSLLQALRVSDLKAALAVFRTGPEAAMAVIDLFDRIAAKLRLDESERMRADAAMRLPAAVPAGGVGEGTLLTGATGFLGAFLLKSLLDMTAGPVTVLVRGRDPAHGVARVRHALLDTDMQPSAVDRALRRRIKVVLGDLKQPRLGLSEADWRMIADRIGRVYHCGAEVDYVRSYNLLRAANVLATREVIDLVAAGCRKSLHHISTTFIFGWSVKPHLLEGDDNAGMENLDFGYAQSKWVAEQLVLRAQRAGLPVTVYRPSLVTASAGGRFVRRDITARVLGYMIRHGLTVDVPNQVSFLPVDVCARNIVALSLAEHGAGPVFHMTSDAYHTMADITDVITRRFGYPFDAIGLEEFVAHAHRHCRPDDDLYPLLSFYDRNTKRILRMGGKRYDSTAYRHARDREPAAFAHPTLEATVDPIVVFLQREGLIPPAPGRASGASDEAVAGALA